MNYITVIFSLLVIANNSLAQTPTLEWAINTSPKFTSNFITSDSKGNIYSADLFKGKIDFDPGPDTNFLNSEGRVDIYIQKFTSKGRLSWVKQIKGTPVTYSQGINSLSTDQNGNLYCSGHAGQSVDLNPGSGVFNPKYGAGYYILKLDSLGKFRWAVQSGGDSLKDTIGSSMIYEMIADAEGYVYNSGSIQGTVAFKTSSGVEKLSSAGATRDLIVQKWNPNGVLIWVKQLKTNKNSSSLSITIDNKGNVIHTGLFEGSVDFDPSSNSKNLISNGQMDAFIQKLDSDGNLLFAHSIGGTQDDIGESVTTDTESNILMSGTFSGSVDFDPSAKTEVLTGKGSPNVFILKLDPNGNFIWAKIIEGKTAVTNSTIISDQNNNILTTGEFYSETDFDPGIKTHYLTPHSYEVFVQKLYGNGDFDWAVKLGEDSHVFSTDMDIDGNGKIIVSGSFSGSGDFDPGPNRLWLSSAHLGLHDTFIAKMDIGKNTSIENSNKKKSLILVFPNPNDGTFKIHLKEKIDISFIRIYDVQGKIIKTFTGLNYPNKININLNSGLYFVQAIAEEKSQTVKVIIY